MYNNINIPNIRIVNRTTSRNKQMYVKFSENSWNQNNRNLKPSLYKTITWNRPMENKIRILKNKTKQKKMLIFRFTYVFDNRIDPPKSIVIKKIRKIDEPLRNISTDHHPFSSIVATR